MRIQPKRTTRNNKNFKKKKTFDAQLNVYEQATALKQLINVVVQQKRANH